MERTMSIEAFAGYLERLEHDFEVDEENAAIDIRVETSWGHAYTVSLVEARTAYSLFVAPLLELGDHADTEALHRRLLELSDDCRYVKFGLDADGDVKLSAEGFARLDALGQFRRRLDAILAAVEEHGRELASLADGRLA
jgi:hypothetical protein